MKEVSVAYSNVTIPTYPWGGSDREAPFIREFTPRGQPVYPYTSQEKISEEKEDRTYKTVLMENEFLKLTFLPEMNGKLYSAFDKVNKKEIFYNNPQIKPSLFGLRGAWCANGVEYNFPNSHSTTTLEPIEFQVVKHEDGSASFICGDCEQVSRMLWSVEVTLRPGSAAIEMLTRLYNRTELPKRFYYWMNAAVPLYPETQFIYPESTRRLYTHPPMDISRIAYLDYPLHKGKDISMFKNIPQHFPVFAETMSEDFFGVYHHHLGYGLVHVADHALVRGRKIWMFGNARDGRIWIDLLTDSKIDYCEVQTGPFSLQSDYRMLQPGRMHVQNDTWFPVCGLGGFNAASEKIAANIVRTEKGVNVKVNSAYALNALSLRVMSEGNCVAEKMFSCDVLKTVELDLPCDFSGDFSVAVSGEHGNILLSYNSKRIENDAEPSPVSVKECSEDIEGRYWEEQGWPARAYEIYSGVSSGNAIIAKARIDMDSALFDKALDSLEKLLLYDSENAGALFFAAICLKRKGELRKAERYLSRCADNALFTQDASIQLAEISLMQKKYQEAVTRLEHFASNSPQLPYPLALLALAFRKNGDAARALSVLEKAEKIIPFEPLVPGEIFFLNDPEILKTMRFQMLLETVTTYMNINEYADALEILNAYIAAGNEMKPLLLYYKSFLENNSTAMEFPEEKWDFVFRCESEKVLKAALTGNEGDRDAILYHLGNFYAYKRRWDNALACWHEVKGKCKPLALRCEGLYWWKITGNLKKACACYETASSFAACGAKTLWEYDHLLSETDDISGRIENLEKHENTVLLDKRLLLRKADALVSAARPEEAMEILENNRFPLCEGKILPRLLYEDACWQLAERLKEIKKPDEALAYLMRPLAYPENLGVGKPAANMTAEWHWRCGKHCLDNGDHRRAEEFFKNGTDAGEGIPIDFFPLKKLVWTHDNESIDVAAWLNLLFRMLCCLELKMDYEYENLYFLIKSFLDSNAEENRLDEREPALLKFFFDAITGGKSDTPPELANKVLYSRIFKTAESLRNQST